MRLGVNIDHVATLRQARKGRLSGSGGGGGDGGAGRGGPDHACTCARIGATSTIATSSCCARPSDGTLNLEMAAVQQMLELALPAAAGHRHAGAGTARGADHRGGPGRRRQPRGSAPGWLARSAMPASKSRSSSIPTWSRSRPATGPTRRRSSAHRPLLRRAQRAGARARAGAGGGGGKGGCPAGLARRRRPRLDYWNVRPVAGIGEITELNIGYAIVCRAVLTGLARAVREMKDSIG